MQGVKVKSKSEENNNEGSLSVATKCLYFVPLLRSAAVSLLQASQLRSPHSRGVFAQCGNAALDKHLMRLDTLSCSSAKKKSV